MKRISFLWLSPTLTALGQKFRFDAHYYAKNSSLVLIGHAVSILRGLVSGYLVARFFEQELYGQYQFMLSVLGTLSFFGLTGLAHSVTTAWARGDAFSLRRITQHQLKVCLIASMLLLAAIPFLPYYNREELWPLFLFAAVCFPLPPIAMVHFGGYTVGKGRFDISLRASIMWSILMIIATLGIVFFHQSAFLMLVASMCIPSLVYLFYSRKIAPPEEEGNKNSNAIIRYAWQLTAATFPVEVVWYIDKLLISHFFGLNQLAIFSIALLIPDQAKSFVKQFMPIGFVKQAAGHDTKERRIRLLRTALLGALIFAIGIGLYIALCPFLFPLLFPKYWSPQMYLLTSIAAATLITTPGGLFAQYLIAQRMIRENRVSTWSSAALFCVALFALIPAYGLLGAVLARGVFRFTYLLTTAWFVLQAPIRK